MGAIRSRELVSAGKELNSRATVRQRKMVTVPPEHPYHSYRGKQLQYSPKPSQLDNNMDYWPWPLDRKKSGYSTPSNHFGPL